LRDTSAVSELGFQPAAAAEASWRLLLRESVQGVGTQIRVSEPRLGCWARAIPDWLASWPIRRRVASWPLSQVLWCASVIENSDPVKQESSPDAESLWQALEWYRRGDAYVDSQPRGRRYFDDNAWLGLVAAQQALFTGRARWWSRAVQLARFLQSGCTPTGGVLWVEGGDTLNACSTGSAGVLFAVVAQAPGLSAADRRTFTEQATASHEFLQTALLRSDGLIADHLRADGSVEPSVWTYNQGLALRLAGLVGDHDAARGIEESVLRGVSAAEMRRQPAVFTSIWWRCLLAHCAVADRAPPAQVAEWLRHCVDVGRDEQGWFRHLSRYDEGLVLDHAAVTGLLAAYANGPALWRNLL
jgi:hypothetical protein